MKKKWLVGLFAFLALIQLAVPASLIVDREVVLRTGRQYRFKIRPIDPYDVFRGRYVDLGFERDEAPNLARNSYQRGQKVYALLAEGADGFAYFTDLSTTRPTGGAYLRTRVSWPSSDAEINLALPFNRYYLEEEAAPAVERAMPWTGTERTREAYVTVRTKAGRAVLEELYLDGEPVGQLIREGRLGVPR